MKHFLHTLMGCLLLVAMTACEKDTMPEIFAPKVETGVAENIYRKGATLSGSIQLSEGVKAESYGILFSNYPSMAEATEIPVTSGETDFSVEMQDLEPNKTYYFCTYAYSGYSMIRGEVRSFTTSQSNAPMFQTPVISNRTVNSFDITSTLLDDGGSELMLSGFCYNKVGEKIPTFIDLVENVELSGNAITATISGLNPNTPYQIRAYGASGNGLAYSDLVTVITETAVVPFLSAVEPVDTTSQSITVMASVLESGSAEVTEVGFCYSTTNSVPTLADNALPVANYTGGDFATTLQGISLGSTYYIRAYAKNEYGTGYSEVFAYTPVQAEVAYLVDGRTFNERIKQLVNGNVSDDHSIVRIEFVTGADDATEGAVEVSADNSPVLVHASFNSADGLLTVSTSAKSIEIADASYMFSGLRTLREIDLGNFVINEMTTNLVNMFDDCNSLTTLDTSGWNTANVVDMGGMFDDCSSLTSIDVAGWNTANVVNMECMFGGCSSLTSLDLSGWDITKVTDIGQMFASCSGLTTLDLSGWNTSNVTSVSEMFVGCFNLRKLNIANWSFSSDVDLNHTFEDCASISQSCEITATQAMQEFLLDRTEITEMNPLSFIWTNGNVDNDGSSVDDMPNQEW